MVWSRDDAVLSFAAAETVVVAGGFRQLSFRSPDSALVIVDWDSWPEKCWSGVNTGYRNGPS